MKHPVAERWELGNRARDSPRRSVTDVVHDRSDVLAALVGAVPNLYLFGAQKEPTPAFAKHVADWSVASDVVLADLAMACHVPGAIGANG